MTDNSAPSSQPLVSITMGSQSDWPTMKHAAESLEKLGIPTKRRLFLHTALRIAWLNMPRAARDRGLQVIIAGASGAAHLPGMTAPIQHFRSLEFRSKAVPSRARIPCYPSYRCRVAFLLERWQSARPERSMQACLLPPLLLFRTPQSQRLWMNSERPDNFNCNGTR